MVALKPATLDRYIADAGAAHPLILIFGTDPGLIAERADKIAKSVLAGNDDPFALVRLDAAELGGDTSRIVDEARTISMFGGRRVVLLRLNGNRNMLPALEPLFDDPPIDCIVIVEAGDLKRGTALRNRFERAEGAAAIACYPDSERDLERLVESELAADGLSIEHDARTALLALLGADRGATRAELAKLRLYAHGTGTVTLDHVTAVIGDASAIATDEVIDAAATGRHDILDNGLSRLLRAGVSAQMVLTLLLRHFQLLDRARAEFDRGRAAADIVRHLRPPVFFRRQAAVATAIERWPRTAVERGLTLIEAAQVDARLRADLAATITSDVLHRLAAAAKRRPR
ncbi:MAG: DNA polymerase III subunit delta [Hyphomicrobiales bacterium]|nr:DNA polymerase III subunit delta [Hyphomicrobiales bacterium]